MASYGSNALAAAFLDWMNGDAMPTPPAGIFLTLNNGDPTGAGTGGTDVTNTGFGFARLDGGDFTRTGRVLENDDPVEFGTVLGSITVTHVKAWSASSAGTLLAIIDLGTTYNLMAGQTLSFPAGDLKFTA